MGNGEPRVVVMGMPPDMRRSSISLTDCSGLVRPKSKEDSDGDADDEKDHPTPPPRDKKERRRKSMPALGQVSDGDKKEHPRKSMPTLGQVSDDSEVSPRDTYRDSDERQRRSMPALGRQDSEQSEAWSPDNSYKSLNERTQREIMRLNSFKVEDTARVRNSAQQLYFHDTSGKWALFTLRHSKRNPKVVVLELTIQDKKTRKVKNIVFDNETSTLTDNRNTISLPSEYKGMVMKSLHLLCKVASVQIDF